MHSQTEVALSPLGISLGQGGVEAAPDVLSCLPLQKHETASYPTNPTGSRSKPVCALLACTTHCLLRPSSSMRAEWNGLRPSKVMEWQAGPAVLRRPDPRGIQFSQPLNYSSKEGVPWTAPAHRRALQTNRLQPTRDLDTEVKSPSNQVPVTLFCPVHSTTEMLFKRI